MVSISDLLVTFMDNVGEFSDSVFGWVGNLLTFVTSHPVLLVLVIAMPIVGFAVGLLSRLIRA